MKLILAFIMPDNLNKVINVLADHHVRGLTVSDARGFGQEHDRDHPDHREYLGLEMTRKLRLEIACLDGEEDGILGALYEATHTGQRGDGKVFVLPIMDALRIKTGERGKAAIGPAKRDRS